MQAHGKCIVSDCDPSSTSNALCALLQEPVWPPVTKDTPQGPLVTGALWMSILRGRSVYDGAFVSMDPADPRVGLPLDMHDASSKYGALTFQHQHQHQHQVQPQPLPQPLPQPQPQP